MKSIEELKIYAKENYTPIIREKSGDFLINLLKENNPKTILEIGTAIGYSGSLMLQNSSAKLTTIEINKTSIKIAKSVFETQNFVNRVNLIEGDATKTLEKLSSEGKKFDFIFVDGPKSQYIKQLPFLLKLMHNNTVVLCDNVLYGGKVLSDEYPEHKHRTTIMNLRKFLNAIKENPNIEYKLYDLEDGLLTFKIKQKNA